MSVNLRCGRCGRSTGSPKAQTCRKCLGRAETRRWLMDGSTVIGECLLAQGSSEHSDGRFRVTVMSHDGDGATKTTATVHMLFNEEWGYDIDYQMTELRPSCGHWNCVVKDHWSAQRRKTDRERLRDFLEIIDRTYESDEALLDALTDYASELRGVVR